MTTTAKAFTRFTDSLAQKKLDLDTDTFKVMLLSAYTPAQATHQYVSDVKAAGTEASGTGYTAGGATLASVTWTRSGNVYTFDCGDIVWTTTAGSLAGAYLVFYCSTPGSDATNPVVAYWDLGGTQTSTNGTFTVTIDAAGVVTITTS